MLTRYEQLKAATPHITIYDTRSEEFKAYGKLITTDTKEICEKTLQAIEMPEAGSRYVTALEAIDNCAWADEMRWSCCGGLDEQIGVCWGHSNFLNALEWHTCAEFNVGVTDMVLLLAKRKDLDENHQMSSDAVKAFYVHQGDMIEVYSDSLHFCPCEVSKSGFISIVGLQRGTNEPLKDESKKGMLRATNKWLVAHEKNEAMVNGGAFVGISGENWKINTID